QDFPIQKLIFFKNFLCLFFICKNIKNPPAVSRKSIRKMAFLRTGTSGNLNHPFSPVFCLLNRLEFSKLQKRFRKSLHCVLLLPSAFPVKLIHRFVNFSKSGHSDGLYCLFICHFHLLFLFL